jgi:hypothetical protein
MPTDNQIAAILEKYGEPVQGSVWQVQGTSVIYHKAIERIAAKAGITFDPPTVLRAERDEAVIIVSGNLGERKDWTIGEALIGVNYRVTGKQAAYVYAIAEKRARDRLVLKLIGLQGILYSEEEADEFKQVRPTSTQPSASSQDKDPAAGTQEVNLDNTIEADLKAKITKAKSINAVTDLMLSADTQRTLNDLPDNVRDDVRDFAKERLLALGWPKTKAA